MSEPPSDPQPEVAPKVNPRQGWDVCGQCWCVVADLEQHTAAAHPAPPSPVPVDEPEEEA